MKLHLNEAQMLKEWRLRFFPETANSGCDIERHDGIDLDAWLKARMTDWYSRLLAGGDLSALAPLELCDEVTVIPSPFLPGAAQLTLPEGTVRVIEVALEGWAAAVTPVSPSSAEALSCRGPFPTAGIHCPVAIDHGDRLTLYPASGMVTRLLAVAHTPGLYHLDSAALGTITPEGTAEIFT